MTSLPPEVERVVVYGLGKVTGKALVEALVLEGLAVRVTERDETPEHADAAKYLRQLGATVSFGAPDETWLSWADLLVSSPGIPPSNDLLRKAAGLGLKVWSEVEVGWRMAKGPVFGVTGTNGKTTTTTLLVSMLETGGFPAVAAGNIGLPFVDAARSAPEGWALVCELSSFQLHFIESLRPVAATVLNVADDHYDWHETHENYLLDKKRIVENQTASDLVAINGADPGCLSIGRSSQSQIAAFGLESPDRVRHGAERAVGREIGMIAGVEGGIIKVSTEEHVVELIELTDIRLPGSHNVENVMASALMALWYGVDATAVAHAVRRFEGMPHRTRFVAEIEGVKYVDDSKATNPHATARALRDVTDVILIAGGRAKGLDLSVLAEHAGRLKGLVVMGEAADELVEVFKQVRSFRAKDVEEAVALAQAVAMPGDTVLLSPACSSIDQYANYEERGDRFAAAVKQMVDKVG
ncbi:MAG: UDP-N-acetylmuramoyl-L-alanine--D-glutamate ligase [Actinomycetota bacterium]|nr:UDP-N-acetylmuramoyl-L-alanine--D-glutamate ligase [Actinomycetota bacterium]